MWLITGSRGVVACLADGGMNAYAHSDVTALLTSAPGGAEPVESCASVPPRLRLVLSQPLPGHLFKINSRANTDRYCTL